MEIQNALRQTLTHTPGATHFGLLVQGIEKIAGLLKCLARIHCADVMRPW